MELSQRNQCALAVLQGLIATGSKLSDEELSQRAFEIADAFLEASKVRPKAKTQKPEERPSAQALKDGKRKKRSAVEYLKT